MATEEPRTSSVVRVRVGLVIDPALAVLAARVAQEARAALAVPENQVVPAVRAALVVQENPVAPAARAALVVQEDPAVPVVPAVRVALAVLAVRVVEQELNRVEGMEFVLVAAAPERDPVAVRLRTKSETAKHHRGQVRHHRGQVRHPAAEDPAVVDLAAAAETTREPAATEAAVAWEAAV
jgi:hypothetical protein